MAAFQLSAAVSNLATHRFKNRAKAENDSSVRMSEQNFPSGPWTGFFTYNHSPSKHRMDLTLTFSNGAISGDGADGIGLFIIAGRYDATAGECHWTKTYVGAHDVFYRGFRESKGIWGLWEIRSAW